MIESRIEIDTDTDFIHWNTLNNEFDMMFSLLALLAGSIYRVY
jgi:hypothetical protein